MNQCSNPSTSSGSLLHQEDREAERAQDQRRTTELWGRLNTAKTTGKLFAVLIRDGGARSDLRTAGGQIGQMFAVARERAVTNIFGDAPPPAGVLASMNLPIADFVAMAWSEAQGQMELADAETIGDTFTEIMARLDVTEQPDFAHLENDTARTMSLAGAAAELYPGLKRAELRTGAARPFFLGGLDAEGAMQVVVGHLDATAKSLAQRINPDQPAHDLTVWQSVLGVLARSASASIENEYFHLGGQINDAKQSKDASARAALRNEQAKSPNGILVGRVTQGVERVAKMMYSGVTQTPKQEPEAQAA